MTEEKTELHAITNPYRAADAIQALVWECVILGARAESFAQGAEKTE